ncbi:hypothetical protein LNKW23_17640 [Paralimibaculum aggregatum]|uniref:Uncharacterized protein n=1 Tax=Paralimibaculum aggregatum TaxID=3036245 RepID=A0ABQ6LPV0_9RHOB|nr:hypothetical protein [Limibaculum sp. NKW23]GMG82551.1 hypothetical protein LNKW23_17640 [Limibaculum sp. NKW23]
MTGHPSQRPPRGHGTDPNRLIRYVGLAALEGVIAGWIFLMVLLRMDIGGLGSLVEGSADAAMALVILLMSFGVTFGFVGIAWKVMVMLPGQADHD